jgi:hydroxymethylbilane synthase
MANKLIVSGRDSMLSKAQIEIFVSQIAEIGIKSEVEYIKTFGDKNTTKPIHSLEITNPFVKEVHQSLIEGNTHIGISSLKDVEITSNNNEIETIYLSKRENPRDILLLNKSAIEKINKGEKVTIGTSSLRRTFLLERDISKILPNSPKIEIKPIRGNVTTRIALLHSGELDGIVIALAGILRLLKNEKYQSTIQGLLQNISSLVLPISHFPTPPGQGIIIAQAAKNNNNHKEVISKIKGTSCKSSEKIAMLEKNEFARYGLGCRQAYGVTHLEFKNHECTFLNGKNSDQIEIYQYTNFETPPRFQTLCDTRTLKNTFKVNLLEFQIPSNINKFIVSNIKSITSNVLVEVLKHADEVWAAGFETMKKLASLGILCNGCLESLGTDSFASLHFSTKFEYNPSDYCILTHKDARNNETQFHKIETYELTLSEDISEIEAFKVQLQKCDAVFWSSINHYELLKFYFKNDIHITLLGNTYNHLIEQNIQPYGFFNHNHLDFYLQKCHNIQA